MRNIAIVLSSSIGFRNSGMFSVDFAAYSFFKNYYPEDNLIFYVFHLSPESDYPYEELMPYSIYRKITAKNMNEFYCSDLIVYWSDLNHNRHFIEQFVETYIFPDSKDIKEDTNLFYNLYFLEAADDSVFKNVITFGNSLMNIEKDDMTKVTDRYSRNLHRLYKNIRFAMPRDNLSLIIANHFTKDCCQGCDPAFLLYDKFPKIKKENSIGIFIGRRTEISLIDVYNIIVFASNNNMNIEWIPWMMNTESFLWRSIKNPRQAKNLFLHCLLASWFGKKKPIYLNDFTTLARHNMVITDTYHLAINAIKENLPVFCIGSDSIIYNTGSLDLSDKKKEVLFKMINSYNTFWHSYGKLTVSKLQNTLWNKTSYLKHVTYANNNLMRICSKILN